MPQHVFTYQKETPLEERKKESERVRSKFPNRIPVIVEKNPASKDIPEIDKHKFLVPADLTVGQFVYVIRRRISMSPEKALFVFINNSLPPTSSLMTALYDRHRDKDGFLYLVYSGENVFG